MPGVRNLIVELNSLSMGPLDTLVERLHGAIEQLREHQLDDLATRLGQAEKDLLRGDVTAFRKAVNHVVSRLGHVRDDA